MASLGESLSIVIGADSDPLIKELNKAAREINKWGRDVQKNLNDVARVAQDVFGIALGGGILLLTKRAIESASALRDQADLLGVNVEKLQEMGFAARQAGVDSEKFTRGLEKLSSLLGQALGGGQGAQAAQDIFAKWGVAVGPLDDLQSVLGKIADRMASIQDQNVRNALTTDIFGQKQLALSNFLSNGSKALSDAEDRARAYGAVIGGDVVAQMKAAEDQIQASSQVINANLTTALVNVLPLLEGLAKVGERISAAFSSAKSGLEFAGAWLGSYIGGGAMGPGGWAEATKQANAYVDALEASRKISASAASTANTASGSGGFYPGNPAAQRAVEDYILKLQNLHDQMSLSARDQAIARALDQAESIARTNNIRLTEQQTAAIRDAAGANYDLEQAVKTTQEAARGMSSAFETAFDSMTDSTKSFSDSMRQLGLDIIKVIQKALFFKPLENALSGVFGSIGGSLFGGSSSSGASADLGSVGNALDPIGLDFGGFFAEGGNPPINLPSIVGERGPELIVPRQSSTVVPFSKLGGQSITVNNYNTFTSDVRAAVRQEINSVLPAIADMTAASIADKKLRGGSFGKAMSA